MVNFVIGVVAGASFGVLIYACVLAGKRADLSTDLSSETSEEVATPHQARRGAQSD
jgi:hypothetical protein